MSSCVCLTQQKDPYSTMALSDHNTNSDALSGSQPLDDLTRHSSNRSSRSSSRRGSVDNKKTETSKASSSSSSSKPASSLDSPLSKKKSTTLDDLDGAAAQLQKLSLLEDNGSAQEEKAWQHMDSVHSHNKGYTNPYLLNNNDMNNSYDSMDFNDSCASFASFGGCDSEGNNSLNGSKNGSLNDSAEDLSLERANFCRLEAEATIIPKPNRPRMCRVPSVRLNRGPSFRQTSLQFIEEKESSLDL